MSDKNKSCDCSCSGARTVIFPCSGSAEVGELSDRQARKLTKKGKSEVSAGAVNTLVKKCLEVL